MLKFCRIDGRKVKDPRQRFIEYGNPEIKHCFLTELAMAFMYKWRHRMEEQDEKRMHLCFPLTIHTVFLEVIEVPKEERISYGQLD